MRALLVSTLALLVAGCLEVEQHPPWRDGQYDGKTDQRHADRRFHGDRLAWNAVIDNRVGRQDEYRRMGLRERPQGRAER